MEQTIRDLIADGKTAKAITELRRITASDTDLKNEVNLIAARFSEYQSQKRLGLEGHPTLTLELNNINYALLDIIDRLESNGKAISNPIIIGTKSNSWTSSWTKWTGMNDVKSWIAVAAGIAGILTFYFKYCGHISEGGGDKPFSVVVYTHGNGGRQDILQLKETKLVADFGGRREVAKVGENGQNTFNEIPTAFRDKRIGIGLQGTEGYILTYKDSTYLLDGKPIYLAVQSSCRFCIVEGFVQKQDAFIPNVVVSIDNFADTTDAKGYFKIIIPPNKEQSEYATTVSVKGKIVKRLFITPNPKQPAEILIQ